MSPLFVKLKDASQFFFHLHALVVGLSVQRTLIIWRRVALQARAKAERAAKRAEAKAEAAAEAASKDSAAAGSAAAEQDWRQERQRQRSWHLSNAGSSFDTSSSASMVGSLEDSMSTSLESAAGGEIILRDSSDGFLGGGVNGRNGGVHKSNSATLDHSPRALTHDEMVDFFFNSSAETSKATFASVQVCNELLIGSVFFVLTLNFKIHDCFQFTSFVCSFSSLFMCISSLSIR